MYLCYIDEAGCPGALPSATSDIQPILVLTGLFLPQCNLIAITRDFLTLKAQFNPDVASKLKHELDIARYEIKGSDLRRDIRKGNRNLRRQVFGFLDKTLGLLEKYDVKLAAKIYIKKPNGGFDGKAVYASAVQSLCAEFQTYLAVKNSSGIVIADSRTPGLNSIVSHSVFTQKFRAAGDPYSHILEMPVFGHSENHVAIQMADFLSSTLLFSMASHIYCTGHISSVHVHTNDQKIAERYAERLRNIAHRYWDVSRYRGGITVNDAILKRSASLLFPTATRVK
ncbi:MAG: DUF3800 domain-containing protein [Gallionella sp.]|jgi:hypothetical protein|nr:DUF3800 domain-containing protein [Gallionella sp.]